MKYRNPSLLLALLPLALAAWASTSAALAAPLYSESFDSQATAKVIVSKQTDSGFSYVDYSSFIRDQPSGGGPVTLKIPEAPSRIPGSAATRGVILNATYAANARTINLFAAQTPGGTPVNFTGNYRLSYDMWLSVDPTATAGTTEAGLFALGQTSSTIQVSYRTRATVPKIFGWISSEGGVGSSGDLGVYGAGLPLLVRENLTDSGLYGLAFGQGFAIANTPNNQWTRMDLVAVGGIVTVYTNGVNMGTATTAGTDGFAAIGYEDLFVPSIPGGINRQFGLFDNFVVESLAAAPVLEVAKSSTFTTVTFPGDIPGSSLTVTNSDIVDRQINTAAIDGANAADFLLNTPFPLTVGANGGLSFIDLNFSPSTPNGLKVARLTLTTNDPNLPVYSIPLQGRRSINSIEGTISQRVGTVITEGGTATGAVTFTNNSGAPVSLTGLAITGTSSAMFSVTGTYPILIPAGDAASLPIVFSPTGLTGLKSASMDFTTNDAGVPNLSIPVSARYTFGPPLLAHYKMDDTAGTTLADASGANTPTPLQIREAPFGFAQPSLLPGGAGTSVRLIAADTNTTGNFAISNAPHLPDVSFSLWIKPEPKAVGNRRILHRSSLFTTTGTLYSLYLTPAGKLVFEVNSLTSAESADGAILNDTTYHVAITHRDETAFGNTTATRTKLFINGQLVSSALDPVPGYTDYTLTSTSQGLYIGSATGSGQGYTGLIDDLQVYSIELTEQQVAGMFAQPGKTAFELELLPYRITAALYDKTAGTFTLTWNSSPGALYSVQQSTTTSGFTDIPGLTALPATGVSTTATVTGVTGDRRYYQIRRTSP